MMDGVGFGVGGLALALPAVGSSVVLGHYLFVGSLIFNLQYSSTVRTVHTRSYSRLKKLKVARKNVSSRLN